MTKGLAIVNVLGAKYMRTIDVDEAHVFLSSSLISFYPALWWVMHEVTEVSLGLTASHSVVRMLLYKLLLYLGILLAVQTCRRR